MNAYLLRPLGMVCLFALATGISGCATSPDLGEVEADIVQSGLFTHAMDGSSYDVDSIVSSRSVPCRAGEVFGATFKLSGWPDGTTHLPYQAVWNHPPIREPGQGNLVESVVNEYNVDSPNFPSYVALEVPELWRLESQELQNGTWSVEIMVDGRSVAATNFEVTDCPQSASDQ